MSIVDNGRRLPLVIENVFDGVAGVAGAFVSFVPAMGVRVPNRTITGLLDGVEVRLTPKKDPSGPFYTARFEVVE